MIETYRRETAVTDALYPSMSLGTEHKSSVQRVDVGWHIIDVDCLARTLQVGCLMWQRTADDLL